LDQPQTQDGAIDASIEVSEKAPVDRRDFAVLTGASLSAPVLAWMFDLGPFQAALHGRRVTTAMVEHIEQVTQNIRDLDDETGGGDLLEMANTNLQFTTRLLKHGSYTTVVGASLFSATAELCRLAGWLAFDCNRQAAAQAYWLAGLRLAHSAEDRALGGVILSWMSHQAAVTNNPTDALQVAQAAQAGSKGAVSTRDTIVITIRAARAQAQLGEHKALSHMLNEALALLDRADRDDKSYSYWMDAAHLSENVGLCFLDAGRPQQAVKHLTQSIDIDKTYARDYSGHLLGLAKAYIRQGELEQACTLGTQTFSLLLGQINSPRIMRQFRDFQRELAPHDVPCVREFTERARELL